MTTEELILGHFDRALTSQEEKILQERLGASPEARAMFEQHRNLDGYLNNDAMALGPSSRLDEMTIAAALSIVPEVISGGSAAWFSGKMIATVAAVIVGGTSIALLTTSSPKQDTAPVHAAPASVVRTVPATPMTPPQATPSVEAPTNEPATSETPAVSSRTAAKSPAVASTQKARTTAKPKLTMPNGKTTVDDEIKMKHGK